MHLHPLCRPPVLSTQPATGSPQHTWHHRLLAWALGLAALLMLLPGWATAQTGTWSSTDPMGTARREHTATLLPSGKVLVAGGYNGNYLASAELYDPATNTWSTTNPMGTARYFHTATLLPSGKVLVAGGYNGNGNYLASAELYDPATNTWSTTNPMGTARDIHTATLLPSGKVLVAGGFNRNHLSGTELYDPGIPGVTAINPANGPTLGGTPITLTGTQFTGATSATVCGVALTGLAVVNDTTLTGTTPAHAATATACDVVVTTPDGTGTGTALFSYMKSSQTLVFGTAPVLMVGGAAGTVSAASSAAVLNGLTTFSSLTPDTCTVSGTAVSAVAAGTCRVAANNGGNGDYLAAAQVTQDIEVAPAPVRSLTGTPPGASAITASFTTADGTATCGYESTQFPAAAAVGGTLPAGFSFAQGAFGFTTTQCGTGATLALTLTFEQPLAANAKFFKFNGSTWAEFPASISGKTITYNVTDNGAGDSNPADGVITDPVAVGVPVAAANPTPVPTLGQWALVLLSLMAAAVGAGTLRRQGHNRI